MSKIAESVDVNVPVRTAYDPWTQFERFPQFMPCVEAVRQVDARSLHWRARVAGRVVEWDAEIYEQVPDARIAWRSKSGARHEGTVRFESLGPSRGRVTVEMFVAPHGLAEWLGDAVGLVSSRVADELLHFK